MRFMLPVGLIVLACVAGILYLILNSTRNETKAKKAAHLITNESLSHRNESLFNNGYMLLISNGVLYKYDTYGTVATVSKNIPFYRSSCGVLNNRVYCAGGYPNTNATFSYDSQQGKLY